MSNPIVDLMDRQHSTTGRVEAPGHIYKNEDPNMFGSVLKQNPQYATVMDFIRRNGVSAKSAFYLMCKQRGINPDQIIGSLKNRP